MLAVISQTGRNGKSLRSDFSDQAVNFSIPCTSGYKIKLSCQERSPNLQILASCELQLVFG